MSFMKGMRCHGCGRTYPVSPVYVCETCFGPVEVDYEYDALREAVSRDSLGRGPKGMWRYRDLLPFRGDQPVDIGAGFTPLIRADNLARSLGLGEVYIKNDSVNPTWSFKDRVVSVAISQAREFGFTVAGCASTGNLAASVAAHAARAGMPGYVLIPADLERGKVLNAAIYGSNLIAVRGNYDDVNRLCVEIADRYGWAFVNINLRPYYSEGSKTLAFETVEQLGWRVPDHVVVPIAGGALLTKIQKGFEEFHRLGLVDRLACRVHGAQPAGCSPVVQAFEAGSDVVRPVKPDTIVRSLAIGNPADGIFALDTIRRTGGRAVAISDEEVVEGIQLLARTEGIFTETAGGVTIGVLKRLAEAGAFGRGETVVAYITGNGLKTLEAVEDLTPEPVVIEPSLRAFRALYEGALATA